MSNSTHKLKYTGNELDKQLEKIDTLETKVTNLKPSDIGLDKVDNTADMAKPLSAKQQEYVDGQVSKLQTSIDSVRGKNYVERTSTSGVHIGRNIKGDYKGIKAWVANYNDGQGRFENNYTIYVTPTYEEPFNSNGAPVLLITNDGHYYEGVTYGTDPAPGFISLCFDGVSLPIAETSSDEDACTLVHLERPDIGTIPVSLSTFTSGYGTIAVQENAVAFGEETVAIGENSLAAGEGTHTSVKNGVAFGKYNEKDSDRIFQIGNGTSNEDRKDAFYVDKDGSAYGGNGKLVSETDLDKVKADVTAVQNDIKSTKADVDVVNAALEEEAAKLEYYGTTDIEITPESDFTAEGNTITEYTGTAEVVVIPYKVNDTLITSIGGYAFYECSSLTSINIPNSVTSIGNSAFCNCSNLASITIPNSVTSIGISVFIRCSNLTSVNMPNSVTSIDDSTFADCSSLTNINIPNSVTSIGNSVFENCSSLTSINIPNSVTSIGDYAFCDCCSLASINIPNSVTSIGDSVFENCNSLTSINIPNSVTSIGDGAFRDCGNLTSINIPDSVTSIGDSAFSYCSSLTNIAIGNGVTSIGDRAFDFISENAVFYIEEGSYAEDWCWRNNATFRYSDIMNERYLKRFVQDTTDNTKIPYFNLEKDGTLHFYKSSDFTDGDLQEINVAVASGSRYAFQAECDADDNEITQTYAKKTTLRHLQTGMEIPLSQYDNSIVVTEGNTGGTIYLHFDLDGSFSPTYNCQINFTSGPTPTEITYTSTGIINWVGTDCKLQDGKSIFTPSANTRYNIVIYFDGNTFVGCVNGFTPATINNDGTEVS